MPADLLLLIKLKFCPCPQRLGRSAGSTSAGPGLASYQNRLLFRNSFHAAVRLPVLVLPYHQTAGATEHATQGVADPHLKRKS